MKQKLCLDNNIFIELAEPKHIPVIYALVDDYCEEINIDRDRVKMSIREMIYLKGVMLFKFENEVVGGIAGYVLPCMYSDDSMFCEMFFYVRPDYGYVTKNIIKELELVLLPTKVTQIVLGVPNTKSHDKYKRFLSIQGYKLLETHMVKRISKCQ